MNDEQVTNEIDDAISEDTEGHAFRSGRVARPSEDDLLDEGTEGHAFRSGRVAPAAAGEALDDDTEGHAVRSGRVAPAAAGEARGEDTEGHGRFKFVEAAEEGDLVDDDTEGHMYIPKDERTGGSEPMAMRGKVEAAGEDDTDGHAARGRY